jgi:hypothetical protein
MSGRHQPARIEFDGVLEEIIELDECLVRLG